MPTDSSRLVNIIKQNKNMAVNATDIVVSAPKLTTVLTKLQVDNNRKTPLTEIEKMKVNSAELTKIYKRIKSVNENNENIIKLFPDIELAIQIKVSTIISPKNMIGAFLNYKLESPLASASATATILDKIKDHFTKRYHLEDKLPEWIREAMFEKGSYVMAVIPESSVDDIINADISSKTVSTESYKHAIETMSTPMGFLGEGTGIVSVEGYNDKVTSSMTTILQNQQFSITDNFNVLKFPELRAKIRNKIVRDKIRNKRSDISLEGIEYGDIFRKSSTVRPDGTLAVVKRKDETKRTSLGAPMVVKLNSQAVIPIFTPGDPTKHLGYIVLLDAATGYPLNDFMESNASSSANGGNTGQFTNNNSENSLTQKAVTNLIGDANDVGVETIFQIYKDVIEKQIFDKVKKGIYGHDIEISNKNDIYFTMYARALANQKTSMLFLPAELVTYVTYDYNKNGTGRSLLESLSVLMSMRSIMLISKIVSFAKKAIDVTNVNISFDPNDPDPEKTIEEIMDSVIKMRQNFFPLGINNPTDLVDWSQRAGLKFSYENHPSLPNTKIDFEPGTLEHEIPSDDIEDVIRKQCIMSMGLSPEQVDNAFSPEFATTVTSNNVLMAKRTIIDQVKTETFLNKFCHDIIINDEELREVIKGMIVDHIADLSKHLDAAEKELLVSDPEELYGVLIDRIAQNLRVSLPRPESMNIENMAMEYDKHKENLEKVLDSIISTEILSQDTCGDMTEHVDTVKNVYKHYLLRLWMSENNFLPEVFDIIKQTNEGEDKLDLNKVMIDHIQSVMLSSGDLFKKIKESRDALVADVVSVGIGDLEGGTSSSSSDSSSSDDSGDDSGGGDDFGMGDDMGGDDFGMDDAGGDDTGGNDDVPADA